jgi:hypothetical protein
VLYVGEIKKAAATAKALSRDKELSKQSSLAKLLIKTLDEGWTTAEEKSANA